MLTGGGGVLGLADVSKNYFNFAQNVNDSNKFYQQ